MKKILTAICLITLCAILLVSCDSAPSTNSDNYEYYTYQTDYNNYATSNEYAATGNYSPLPTEKAQTNAKPVPVETVTNPKEEYSLEFPDLPAKINYYNSDGSIKCTFEITSIEPVFKYSYRKLKSLSIIISLRKTYDTRGENYSAACSFTYKLYDPDGNVHRSSSYYSPSLATGESVVNKEISLLGTLDVDNAPAGVYKLVIPNIID